MQLVGGSIARLAVWYQWGGADKVDVLHLGPGRVVGSTAKERGRGEKTLVFGSLDVRGRSPGSGELHCRAGRVKRVIFPNAEGWWREGRGQGGGEAREVVGGYEAVVGLENVGDERVNRVMEFGRRGEAPRAPLPVASHHPRHRLSAAVQTARGLRNLQRNAACVRKLHVSCQYHTVTLPFLSTAGGGLLSDTIPEL